MRRRTADVVLYRTMQEPKKRHGGEIVRKSSRGFWAGLKGGNCAIMGNVILFDITGPSAPLCVVTSGIEKSPN